MDVWYTAVPTSNGMVDSVDCMVDVGVGSVVDGLVGSVVDVVVDSGVDGLGDSVVDVASVHRLVDVEAIHRLVDMDIVAEGLLLIQLYLELLLSFVPLTK